MREQRTIRVANDKTTIFNELYEGDKIVDDSNGNVWIVKQNETVKSGNSILSLTVLNKESIEPHSGGGSGGNTQPPVVKYRNELIALIESDSDSSTPGFFSRELSFSFEDPITGDLLLISYEGNGSKTSDGLSDFHGNVYTTPLNKIWYSVQTRATP